MAPPNVHNDADTLFSSEAALREVLSRMGHLERELHQQRAGASYNPHGKLRVYCRVHQVSFTVERGVRQIACQLRGESLGEGLPFTEDWLFCCDCERFTRLMETDTRVTACPACERVWQQYYLCDRCRVLSAMAGERNDERAFALTTTGPHPACPGCLTKAPESLSSHKCLRLGVTLQTKRTSCPFCQKEIQQALFQIFPASVTEDTAAILEKGEIKIQRAVPLPPQLIAETDANAITIVSIPMISAASTVSEAAVFVAPEPKKNFILSNLVWVGVLVLAMLLLIVVIALNVGKKPIARAMTSVGMSVSPSPSPTLSPQEEEEAKKERIKKMLKDMDRIQREN